MNHDVDVVVVGAGFAGLVAARELGKAGMNVVILEARDRIGGRMWSDIRMGEQLEMGGGWIHWMQPHVWAEVTRYQLDIAETPFPEHAFWRVGDKRYSGTLDDLASRIGEGMRRTIEDSLSVVPRPYEALSNKDLQQLDHVTIAERIADLGLDAETQTLIDAMWSQNFNAPAASGALTTALRWGAIANADWLLLLDICSHWKFKDGTGALGAAISRDITGEVRLRTPVDSIDERGDGVIVTTADGHQLSARACVVTVPVGAMGTIEFTRGLPSESRALIKDGQASQGFKVWLRARGGSGSFLAMAPSDEPMTLLQWEHAVGEEFTAFGFGMDARRHLPADLETVQAYVRRLMPDIEVVDFTVHDWITDPYSRQTWAMFRPNQLEGIGALAKAPGRVRFAGSDLAEGWAGFLDGAIESGLSSSTALIRNVLN
ncbi:monoamine oxidase [Mycobacterium sp. MAA66]|uniref:flavin monoamine oxidase family protein n=1 Tax=Mycobacterium sp. MAA66 TaxID=3156297 RepID=UPI003515D511